jgi:hypothetical protein
MKPPEAASNSYLTIQHFFETDSFVEPLGKIEIFSWHKRSDALCAGRDRAHALISNSYERR